MPLICLNKPFRVLSQFRDVHQRRTLAEFIDQAAVYPAGRLDYDSEGLILLTDDGRLQAVIAGAGLAKRYWVQVEGVPAPAQLRGLLDGVAMRGGPARALQAAAIDEPNMLWPRDPPIRQRRNIPTSWLAISIDEGRNRQVRHMTAAVGLPTLRLVRFQIGPWRLGRLAPGELKTLPNAAAWRRLRQHAKR